MENKGRSVSVPLQIRLTISILSLLLCIISAVMILSIEGERRTYRQELEFVGELLANDFATDIEESLTGRDGEPPDRVTERLEIWSSILLSGHVYDTAGTVLSSFLTPDSDHSREAEDFGRRLVGTGGAIRFEWHDDELWVGKTVLHAGAPVAACSIELSTAMFMRKMSLLQNRLILIAAITIVIGVLLTIPISRSITKPLEQMVQVVRFIANGNLHLRIPQDRTDEIGNLAFAFNSMVNELTIMMKRLKESEERYALSVAGANDGIWDWDIRKSTVYLSTRWKKMLGYDDDEITTDPNEWFSRIHPEERKRVEELLDRHLKGETTHFEAEYRILHKNGDYIWVLSRGVTVKDEEGFSYRIAGSQTDISPRKQTENQLVQSALYDSLTDLPNRRFLLGNLERCLADPNGPRFSVLFLDIDRFKFVNDSFGHDIGDQLLIAIARRLKSSLRGPDLLVRLGGDEFIILLQDVEDIHIPVAIANRILDSFQHHFDLNGYRIFMTVSIGVVMSADHYENPEEIIRDADIAMYRAKMQGKGRFEIFRSEMRQLIQKSYTIENNLRMALFNEEFMLYFQPFYSLNQKRILGFESLIRWNHPDQGVVPPQDFIPLAEEIGLMPQIDLWSIEETIRTLSEWRKTFELADDFLMSVNLSSTNFLANKDLVDLIRSLLLRYEVPSHHLGFEVTETSLIPAFDAAASVLREIRGLGCSIMIDDFGTGYSSLNYLHRLPFDYLKIDGSFIKNITIDDYSRKIVRTIIYLARELNLRIIAEGVDSQDKLDKLYELGCASVQGYFISIPLGLEDATRFFRDRETAPQELPVPAYRTASIRTGRARSRPGRDLRKNDGESA